jgi:nucleoside phosphorylase
MVADVLIITTVKIESQAIFSVFQAATKRKPKSVSIKDRMYQDLGVINGASVFMAQSEVSAEALDDFQQFAHGAIAALSPSAVIIVGLAFGMNGARQFLGDILVSQRLSLYELQRDSSVLSTSLVTERLNKLDVSYRVSPWLLSLFKGADLHWDDENTKVHFGTILSVEKFINDGEMIEQLRVIEPRAIGGVVGDAALFAVFMKLKVDGILVKAISGWGDGRKVMNAVEPQRLAAGNAARFVLFAMQQAPFKRVLTDRESATEPVISQAADQPTQQPTTSANDRAAVQVIPPTDDLTTERVITQADDPATSDELGRRPFAEVIAARIEEVWKAQGAKKNSQDSAKIGAFMVHIHGPWGSGKTSVLNFLQAHLQDKNRLPYQQWVVVEFNAWRNQRLRPPWWTLIKEIYTQSARQLGFFRSLLLRARWLVWRIRADWFPPLLSAVPILLAILLITGVIDFGTQQPATNDPGAAGSGPDIRGKAIELGLKILTAVLAAGATVFTLSRSLVLGSARAAQAYTELRSDPLGPIVRLFQKLVKGIRRPLIVFVDDLDRCESKYVVELLEGIQTLFRTAPVTYVVAADRKWICSSFEKEFENFGKTIGESGRPMGYLFLDKVFQVSASIPRLSPEVQRAYWKNLLRAAGSKDPKMLDKTRKQAEQEALKTVKDVNTQKELEEKIAEVRHDPVREQAMRAAAAKQITSAEAQRETEHSLQRFADLLESNPRSMKRLVNAYGLHQATHFLEGRNVLPDALARWTIIELRWPLLAEFLSSRPMFIIKLANGQSDDRSIPRELKKLFEDAEVKAVIGSNAAGEPRSLDEAAIRQIVGLAQTETPLDPVLQAEPAVSDADSKSNTE